MPFLGGIKCCIMGWCVPGQRLFLHTASADLWACFFCPINGKSPCQATHRNVNGFICQPRTPHPTPHPLIYCLPLLPSCKEKKNLLTGESQNIDLPPYQFYASKKRKSAKSRCQNTRRVPGSCELRKLSKNRIFHSYWVSAWSWAVAGWDTGPLQGRHACFCEMEGNWRAYRRPGATE